MRVDRSFQWTTYPISHPNSARSQVALPSEMPNAAHVPAVFTMNSIPR